MISELYNTLIVSYIIQTTYCHCSIESFSSIVMTMNK